MPQQYKTRKKLKHLVRYTWFIFPFFLVGYLYTDYSYYCLIPLGPTFFVAYWLRLNGGIIFNLIPNEPLYNNWFVLFPVAFFYFSSVTLLIKNLINDRGIISLAALIAFTVFLAYAHYIAFQELSLYWDGSARLSALALPNLKF